MPAPWTWVWMLLAVMSLTLGQSVAEVISDDIPENVVTPELRSGKNTCAKCHLLYPKTKYRIVSQQKDRKNLHNVVVLVEDGKTGDTVKLAFRNGIKNEKGVRVLQAQFKSENPCQKISKRCVYRLISRKTGRPFKIDFQKSLQNGKRIVKLAP
ncbi:uncharacterized protein [Drosophila kikkawai]|uniref:Uncharacterized protein n=1 Tax=Drosophila kikkawai TaxID=30033 RepID=A0A6P4I2Y9_DROKI